MKKTKIIIISFSILVILFGFFQLNYENEIFAQSRAYCCNNGHCTYPNVLCSATSTAFLTTDFCRTEYVITCRDCVDYNSQGKVCDNPTNSCKDGNNNCYGWCYVGGQWQWVVN